MMNVKTVSTNIQSFILAVMQDGIVTVVMKNLIHTSDIDQTEKHAGWLGWQRGRKFPDHFPNLTDILDYFQVLLGKNVGHF